jgi:hypothetical protein
VAFEAEDDHECADIPKTACEDADAEDAMIATGVLFNPDSD